MKRIALISFVCAISLAWVSPPDAQTPPPPSAKTPTKTLPPKSAPAKNSSGFQCAPSDPAANGENFPSNLQQLVEDKTTLPKYRLDILACIATHEHDRRVQAERELWLALSQLSAAQDKTASDLKSLRDAVLAVAVSRTPAVGQTPGDDVGTLKLELEKVNTKVTQLCSAIRFSLVMNSTSATPTGGALYNACSD